MNESPLFASAGSTEHSQGAKFEVSQEDARPVDPNCLKGVDDLFLGYLSMSIHIVYTAIMSIYVYMILHNHVYVFSVFRWISGTVLLGRGPHASGFHWATSMRERSCTMYVPDTSTTTSTQESAAAWSQIDGI